MYTLLASLSIASNLKTLSLIIGEIMGLFNLLPKDDQFNGMFETLAGQCVTSVSLLEKGCLTLSDHDSHTALSKLRKECKESYETLSNALCLSFITPFDREDLLLLGSKLYKIVKLTEKIQESIVVNELPVWKDDFKDLSQIITADSKVILPLIKAFIKQNLKAVQDETRVLQRLEGDADSLLTQKIKLLCADKTLSFQEVILRKDIYEMFEKLTDLYRDCGNITLQILLKHT